LLILGYDPSLEKYFLLEGDSSDDEEIAIKNKSKNKRKVTATKNGVTKGKQNASLPQESEEEEEDISDQEDQDDGFT